MSCASCSRSAEIQDLGFIAPRQTQWGAVLTRDSSGIDLFFDNPNGPRRRAWGDDGKFAPARAATEKLEGPLFDGRLALSDLAAATRGSSARLANGWLTDGDRPVGWCPSVARSTDGAIHIAYDCFRSGDYDVVYRAPSGGETIVAGTRRFEAHPSIAIDRSNRVWLAWDSSGERWGSEGALHSDRELHLAVLSDGEWHDAPLAWPKDLAGSTDAASGTTESRAELPRLVAEECGAIWIFYRAMIEHDGEHRMGSNRHVAWQVRALALVDGGWLGPWTLPQSDGGNADSLAAIALPGEGVLAVYETDRRLAQFETPGGWYQPIGGEAELHAVRLHAPGAAPKIGPARRTGRIDPPSPRLAEDPDPTIAPAGFTRVWGDLHRHTDLSRCKMDLDGSAIDQFRYALDVAHLDFVAITDHFQHMTLRSWRFLREATSRFVVPRTFTTLYGFEVAFAHGHRNLLCADPALAEAAPIQNMAAEDAWRSVLKAPGWIAIPHQLADPMSPLTWTNPDPDLEPLVEIYQQRRGAYERPKTKRSSFQWDKDALGVVDYLEAGRRFGLVASSDHISSGHAFTAVYVRDRTRKELFDSLRARRTYAATAKIALDVEVSGLVMGQEGHVESRAPLVIRADAGRPIADVEVIRNGELAMRWHGEQEGRGVLTLRVLNPSGRRDVTLDFEDTIIDHAEPQSLESDDAIVQADRRVVLQSRSDASMDEDGVAIPLTSRPSSAVVVRSGSESKRFTIAELRAGAVEDWSLNDLDVDLRVDDPPLGESKLEREWKPEEWKHGDWVYVRISCVDGEMAWSSPIWVD
jgi:hypothetical protein